MKGTQVHLCAVVNGHDFFVEDQINDARMRGLREACKDAAQEAVRDHKLSTPRKSPKTLSVPVFQLQIVKGELQRKLAHTIDVDLPLVRMTEDDYNEAMEKALVGLPPEFAEYVRNQAWSDGHANGYEEVVNLAESMASSLCEVIDKYEARKAGKKRKS